MNKILATVSLVLFGCRSSAVEPVELQNTAWVCFSPDGNCEAEVVRAIDGAKKSLHMSIYVFSSQSISNALYRAHKRGVQINLIMDSFESTHGSTVATHLSRAGINVMVDPTHPKMHDKFVVIDGQLLLTGSFNYSRNANLKNAENLLAVRDSHLAAQYIAHWNQHLKHSKPYSANDVAGSSPHDQETAAKTLNLGEGDTTATDD